MKRLLALAIALLCWTSAFAQEDALEKGILIDQATNTLEVFVPPASLTDWNVKSKWVIVVIDAASNVHHLQIDQIAPNSKATRFTITPDTTGRGLLAAPPSKVIVTFGSKVISVPIPKSPSGAPTAKVTAAANKQSSDLYLSGGYSPALNGGDPQYSIDGFAAVMFDLKPSKPELGQLGFVGSVKTDRRKKVNPDSYRTFLAYQNVPISSWWGPDRRIQGAQFTWLAAGAEFDRKAKNVNFITAPYLDFPIRLFPKEIQGSTVPMAVLTPTIGFETGWNFKNALEPQKGSPIFRGVVGADLLYRFNAGLPGFEGIEFASSWMMRLPAKKEIYTLTEKIDGEDVEVPYLNRKPRHYVKSELTFKLNRYFGLTAKYEYGMVPPVFRRVDHKLSFGFTFSAKQVSGGVPSTIRNK